MYSNGVSINIAGYQSYFASASGHLSVPVSPSAVVYTQLDYVRGTPSDTPAQGVSLSKVHILNALIQQLVNMKKDPFISSDELDESSDEEKDQMIKQLQQEIKSAVSAASAPSTYGFAGVMPESAGMVSIFA